MNTVILKKNNKEIKVLEADISLYPGWVSSGNGAVVESTKKPVGSAKPQPLGDDLTKIKGVGPALAANLVTAGYGSYKLIAEANSEALLPIDGVSVNNIERIIEGAKILA